MAMIENLGGVASFQATASVKPVQTTPVEQSSVRIMEESGTTQTPKVDANTPAVEKVQEKEGADIMGERPELQQPHSNEQLKKAVDEINKKMTSNSEALFGIHEGTNRVTIKIVDKTTKKVIKELPPEKTLDMIAKVWEMAGILVDEKR